MNIIETIIMIIMISIVASLYLALFGIIIVSYILEAKSLYTIAARRGISNPWLAWIPVVNLWIVGRIAEDYCLKAEAERVAYAKKMLIFAIIAATLFSFVLSPVILARFFGEALLILFVFMAYFGFFVFFVLTLVQYYKAMYKVLRSCAPDKAVVYLLLYIFTPAGPFLLYSVRNNDLGLLVC